jgi:diguanylate cyclase (GGDEF)-like protein
MEKRFLHKDGRVIWAILTLSVVRDGSGRPLHSIAQIQDITERKRFEASLHHQARHDALTGLPNRVAFLERLDQALAAPGAGAVSLIFLDLDGFKQINDTLGHHAGDQVLAEVGRRLAKAVRAGDAVARFGGDEFTILLAGVGGRRQATRAAARIVAHLEAPIALGDRRIGLGVSVGIAVAKPGTSRTDTLLREADAALYRAKGARSRGAQPRPAARSATSADGPVAETI